MKIKVLVAAAVAATALGALAAPAGAGKGRTVERSYNGFNRVTTPGADFSANVYGCVWVGDVCAVGVAPAKAKGKERHVSVKIADATGGAVGGRVLYRHGNEAHSQAFCGATEMPIRINPRSQVTVMTDAGGCVAPDGIPTTGTVRLTFIR